MKKKKDKFIKKTIEHQLEKAEDIAYKSLALSLKGNIAVFDLPYYILQKVQSIIEESFKSTNFINEDIIKLREEFLKEKLKEMRGKIEYSGPKEENDETDKRDNLCDPIAYEIAKMIVDEELIFSDKKYFNEILSDEESIPLETALMGYKNALEEVILKVISEHWRRSTKQLWGVDKEDITFEMLDEILKLDNKENKE